MEARELIGNYFYSIKFNQPVIITAEDIYDLVANADGADISHYIDKVFQPIPLTEEWLKKPDYYINLIRKGVFQIDRFKLIWKPEYKYWYVVDSLNDTYISKVEFVHEWQNLYFALNGKELKTK